MFILKRDANILKISSQIKKLDLYPKNGDNPKSVTLKSDKIVEFIKTFGPPVCFFFYYLMLFLCILDNMFKFIFISLEDSDFSCF